VPVEQHPEGSTVASLGAPHQVGLRCPLLIRQAIGPRRGSGPELPGHLFLTVAPTHLTADTRVAAYSTLGPPGMLYGSNVCLGVATLVGTIGCLLLRDCATGGHDTR